MGNERVATADGEGVSGADHNDAGENAGDVSGGDGGDAETGAGEGASDLSPRVVMGSGRGSHVTIVQQNGEGRR